jgi:hypothetical protein
MDVDPDVYPVLRDHLCHARVVGDGRGPRLDLEAQASLTVHHTISIEQPAG